MSRTARAQQHSPQDGNGALADMSFEQALQELEQIVSRLERGDVGLEQSIALYERGEALRGHCDALLKVAEAKVERLTVDGRGQPTGAAPLEVEAAR